MSLGSGGPAAVPRRGLAALLAALNLVNYLDRYVPAAVLPASARPAAAAPLAAFLAPLTSPRAPIRPSIRLRSPRPLGEPP